MCQNFSIVSPILLNPFKFEVMKGIKLIAIAACIALLVPVAKAQKVEGEAPAQFEHLVKVNLLDFAFGQYTAVYERVLGPYTSVAVNLGGIGYFDESYSYSIGSYYDEWGMWQNTNAHLEMEVSGWELTPEIRRYGFIFDGMPEGLFASAFVQLRGVTAEVDETLDLDPDASELYGLDYPHEIDHTLNFFSFGAGFNLGYQWLADNGLSVETYFGPMFRSVNRTFDFAALPSSDLQDVAEDAVVDRIRADYWLNSANSNDLFTGRTGPWIRGGISIGISF
jgi:hypothetical protein